MSVVGVLEV